MKHFSILSILFFLFIALSSCSDDKDEPKVPVISLNKEEITFSNAVETEVISVKTKGDWEITSVIPEWLVINKKDGTGPADIEIQALRNDEVQKRETTLIFVADNEEISLRITQEPIKDSMYFISMPLLPFSKVDFTLGANKVERLYNFTSKDMFVQPGMDDHVFLGNLVNPNLSKNTELKVYEGYTFNPISFSAHVGKSQQNFSNTKEKQDAIAAQLKKDYPNAGESFHTNGVARFYSYRQLHLFGMGNFGIELDKELSDSSYREKEMTKKTGLLYTFSQTYFSLTMDYPEKLVKEEIKEKDFPDKSLAYVSQVSYGRMGILVVESDHPADKVRLAVNRAMGSHDLSEEDKDILNKLDACHFYFDKSHTMQKEKGHGEVISSYSVKIEEGHETDMYPLKFILGDYFEHSTSDITFPLLLP